MIPTNSKNSNGNYSFLLKKEFYMDTFLIFLVVFSPFIISGTLSFLIWSIL